MMRLLRRALGLVVILSGVTWAGDPPDMTEGAYNGLYWTRCSISVKAGFVVGFSSAMASVMVPSDVRDRFAVSGTVADVVSAIDDYYRKNSDLRAPIWLALRIIRLQREGLTSEEIGGRLVEEGVWKKVMR